MPLPITQTLAEVEIGKMLHRAQEENTRARQADAERRLLILEENWTHLVKAYINRLYNTTAVKKALCLRVKRNMNLLRRLTNRVCVAYKITPVRRLEGASEETQRAFKELLLESNVATKAKEWHRKTFALNRCVVVPVVRDDVNGRGRRLDFEKILPHAAEAFMDASDPMGVPAVMTYGVKDGSDFTDTPITTVILDRELWRYYDQRGQEIRERRVAHGAGVFPGTPFALADPTDDWWLSNRGGGVVDATIEVGHLGARMDWVRHGQDRMKEFLFAERLKAIPNQIAGAEGPVEVPLGPEDADYKILNAITSIDEFAKHIRFHGEQAAEDLSVPPTLGDMDLGQTNTGNVFPGAAARQHASLDDVRRDHVGFLDEKERDLWWRTALVLRGSGHPLARKLQPDEVWDRFTVEFAPLTFVEHPKTENEMLEQEIDIGLISTYQAYQRKHPGASLEEARERVQEAALQEGELNQFYIHHNIPRGSDARKRTLAQIQGGRGGERSGDVRGGEVEDDDSGDDPGRGDSEQRTDTRPQRRQPSRR